MSSTILYSGTLKTLSCGTCGIPFAMPRDMLEDVRATGTYFWCPNGHQIHYGKSENTRLSNEVKFLNRRLKQERADLDHTKNRLRATKGAHTRTKKRIHNGVCPHCNRHFANVQRHMESQHPTECVDE